ncbi:hypothetical protein T439DRAFT_323663 [Meredithblackwellia eburnea MCA 4105]
MLSTARSRSPNNNSNNNSTLRNILHSTTNSIPKRYATVVTFSAFLILSFLFAPNPSRASLYDPQHSAIYEPPPQPPNPPHVLNSVIVPAYREKPNIRNLVTKTIRALPDSTARHTEIVIVDDASDDGSEEEVALLASEGWNVRILVRRGNGERGLSSAVLRGFEHARGKKLLVMDADLQHPPKYVGPMLDALTDATPFAIGTRYGEGVSMSKDWPMYRRVISWGARLLAKPLTSASDPMSGFFAIQKELFLKAQPINPSGFKIALELLLKSPLPPSGLAEVPYSFGTRTFGQSKLGAKVMLRYVGQLLGLYAWKWGMWWHYFVAASFTLVVVVGRRVWVRVRRRMRGEDWLLPSSTRQTLKQKMDG